jgi:4-hydroxybenzoyl-CoA thioesterase
MDAMAYTQRIDVRFPDVDFARVVYFPRLFDYCHRTFEDFFAAEVGMPYARMLGERKVGFPARHAEADFQAPLRFGDVCRVVMDVLELGDKSLTCRFRLFLGETSQLCAMAQVTQVAIDMDTFKARALPADLKAIFAKHLVEDAEETLS